MSSSDLHTALLRPSVIHIMRAVGFSGCKPSVLDAMTDLAARYMRLLAQNTAHYAYDKSCTYPDHPQAAPPKEGEPLLPLPSLDDAVPGVTDIRLALAAAAFFSSATTPAEEAWQEVLRRPLSSYHPLARPKERLRRDEEDTKDVREFIDWIQGPVNLEIRRIANMLPTETDRAIAKEERVVKDDFLAALKKKHSKTADSARYTGTVIGKPADDRPLVKIDGGPSTLQQWQEEVVKRNEQLGREDSYLKRKQSEAGIDNDKENESAPKQSPPIHGSADVVSDAGL